MQIVDPGFEQTYVPAPFLAPGQWKRPRRRQAAPRLAPKVGGADLLTLHLDVVNSAIGVVSRQKQLSPDDREELASMVYVRLLEDDCSVLRQFRAESTLRTFLVVVVQRILIDTQNARYGKWRPSTRAQRLGPVAVQLERLVYRNGLSLDDAAETLRRTLGISDTDDELSFLLSLLRQRTPRRFVSLDTIQERASTDPAPDERLLDGPARHTLVALKESIARLSPPDRRLLRLRFDDARRLSDIARLEGVDQKSIYRKVAKLLTRLRAELESQGISELALVRRSTPRRLVPSPARGSARLSAHSRPRDREESRDSA